MAIIGFSASRGIPGGMDIHAGIPEEGDPSRERWQEDDQPRIAHQSTSAAPTSLPVMTAPSTSATISTPSTASTATASIIVRGCQCSQDLVDLEREKVALLRDVCGLLRESADYHKEVIVLKRAKLDIMARQLALEEETRSSKGIFFNVTGREVGAAEVDWWAILGSSSSCHCSREGSPSSVIPFMDIHSPGDAMEDCMAMARSSSSLRDCTVFTPAPVKLVCCRTSDAFFFAPHRT
ncbi:unnamed protein product [Gadus morhua 'NCC']